METVRIAWFSPVPPDRSGIAAYTAELIPLLAPQVGAIDLYHADRHDFVWRHRREPYDLIVYQLGNSASHDFMWAYLFRYPGLLVLHDAQVHQARALWLLKRLEPRLDDYLAELAPIIRTPHRISAICLPPDSADSSFAIGRSSPSPSARRS